MPMKVTDGEIRNAVKDILESGHQPTVAGVKRLIGYGGTERIRRAINELAAAESPTPTISAGPDEPTSNPSEVPGEPTETDADVERRLKAEWQRKWRASSGKLGATIYLSREEVDVLDYVAYRLLVEFPGDPKVVGRPAALRSLIHDYVMQHGADIEAFAQGAPPPEKRATYYQQELGKRRQGARHSEFEHLPREVQQRLARAAMARKRLNEDRRRLEAAAGMFQRENDGEDVPEPNDDESLE